MKKGALFVGSIEDADVAKMFAEIMTGFVYLEDRMASTLAVLLGSPDEIAAAYVLRAIKSPAARVDVMKELLEGAPINRRLGGEYDHIIREFRTISKERNRYAHGRWWTDYREKKTILDETDDPNASLHVRRPVGHGELLALRKRMLDLHSAIRDGPEAELKKRQKAGLRPRGAPSQGARPRRNAPK
jgi:hypothetical protein